MHRGRTWHIKINFHYQMHLLFSLQDNEGLCGHYTTLFCLFWWFLRSLESLNYSLWNMSSLVKQNFFSHRKNWWFKNAFFWVQNKIFIKPCLPISQHLFIKTCHRKSYGDKQSSQVKVKIMEITDLHDDFYIPSPVFQHSTNLYVCTEHDPWGFLPSQSLVTP